jgi:hypothetical protein
MHTLFKRQVRKVMIIAILPDDLTAAGKAVPDTPCKRAFAAADQAEMVDAYVAAASTKEDFLKLVLDERKWEFAGENMRWKDLVRNNMYAEKVFFTFLDYYAMTEAMAGTSAYIDMVEAYDGFPYQEKFVSSMYCIYVKNYVDPDFPNRGVYMFYVANRYDGSFKNPTGTAPAKYFRSAAVPGCGCSHVLSCAATARGSSASNAMRILFMCLWVLLLFIPIIISFLLFFVVQRYKKLF